MDPYAPRNPAGAALSSRLLSRLPRYAIGVAACGVAAAALLSFPGLGPWYLQRQDQWLLIAGALLLITCLRGLADRQPAFDARSEGQTSELQSLMRSSYAVFCLKKQIPTTKVRLDMMNCHPRIMSNLHRN